MPYKTKKCSWCGVEFEPMSPKQGACCPEHAKLAKYKKHNEYLRAKVREDPDRAALAEHRSLPHAERFWSQVDKKGPDECWEWRGVVSTTGYGDFHSTCFPERKAHRIAFSLTHGEIPQNDRENASVCHTCDNRLCCNPAHLVLESHAWNMTDKTRKDRVPHGEGQWKSVLTSEQVREIREKYVPWKYTIARLAEEYGVSDMTVWYALKGKTWSRVK